MVSFTTFAVAVAGVASVAVVAIDLSHPLEKRQGAIAIQNWGNENAVYNFTSGSAGKFSVDWNNPPGGNFVAGKGYRAQNMLFNYTGSFQVKGNAYLALYGWTTNPLVEYYIMESFGSHNPSDNANSTQFGEHESDGGKYELWMKWRVNAPSIIGDATFPQYWSVRTKNHCGGTINTGNHFRAWEAAGLPLGAMGNMFMAIEGQLGIGSANITVGVAPTTVVPETTTATIRTERRTTTTSRRVTTTPVLTTTRSSTPLATTSRRTTTPITSSSILSTTRSTTPVTTPATTSLITTIRTTTRTTTSTTRRRCPWC